MPIIEIPSTFCFFGISSAHMFQSDLTLDTARHVTLASDCTKL